MDKQILLNYCVIFVIPLIAGVIIRFVFRKFSKSWLITLISAVLTVISGIVTLNPPVQGSELYGLITIQFVCFTIASLLVGLITRKSRRG